MKKLILCFSLFVLLATILFALSGAFTSHALYDPITYVVAPEIGAHVFIVSLLIAISDLILWFSYDVGFVAHENRLIFHGSYAVTGVFFAFATGYQGRANYLSEYFADVAQYVENLDEQYGLALIPHFVDEFSSAANMFYMLSLIGATAVIVFAIFIYSDNKNNT